MIASPTTWFSAGSRPSAGWAQARLEAARPSKRQRLSEALVLLLSLALVGLVILYAREASQAGFQSYARGARNVTISALALTPRSYEDQRVHARGQAGTVYATDNQYWFVLAEPGSAPAGDGPAHKIMVVASTGIDVAGGRTVDVWGVVTSAKTAGATARAGSLSVLTLNARYVRAAP